MPALNTEWHMYHIYCKSDFQDQVWTPICFYY